MSKRDNPFNLKTAKPTPAPWQAVALNWGWQIMAEATPSEVIGTISGKTEDPRKDARGLANVRQIVTAVNAHDDLLAACKAALVALERSCRQHGVNYETLSEVKQIQAAIEKAEPTA